MARSRRDVLAVIGDTHIGSTTALCPHSVELDDGGVYHASKGQQWLWSCWQDFWAQARATKPAGGGVRYVVHLGDVVEGDHHNTSAIISRNPVTMLRLASEILEPVRKWSDRFFVLRGTEAHAGEAGQWDEILADDLEAERCPATNTASWWHLGLAIGGVLFDFAHHPPSNPGRAWTRAGASAVLAFSTFAEYAESGENVPDFAVRGHIHRFTDSGWTYRTRGVTAPAWQLSTPFAARRWPGHLAHIGGLLFSIENNSAQLRAVRYTPERSEPWQEPAPERASLSESPKPSSMPSS